jgi:hypothetical protein
MKKLKLAIVAVLTSLLMECGFGAPAYATTVVACTKVSLPGKAHTLNPFDPPEKQVQEKVTVCQKVDVGEPLLPERYAPLTDPVHDHRAVA